MTAYIELSLRANISMEIEWKCEGVGRAVRFLCFVLLTLRNIVQHVTEQIINILDFKQRMGN